MVGTNHDIVRHLNIPRRLSGSVGGVRIFVCETLRDFSTAVVGACDEPTGAVGKSVLILRDALCEAIFVKDTPPGYPTGNKAAVATAIAAALELNPSM